MYLPSNGGQRERGMKLLWRKKESHTQNESCWCVVDYVCAGQRWEMIISCFLEGLRNILSYMLYLRADPCVCFLVNQSSFKDSLWAFRQTLHIDILPPEGFYINDVSQNKSVSLTNPFKF